MKELKHELLTNNYTRIFHYDEPNFNAPHHFEVYADRGLPAPVKLAEIHFQEGAIKEHGVNGLHNEDLIHMVLARLNSFQGSEFNCYENAKAIRSLEKALYWLRSRTNNREKRGVEGTSNV